MFKTKRAQSEIITTVLIILLVLAAIIIVWQVVSSTINTGKQNIEQTSQCIGIDVNMVSAHATVLNPTTGAVVTTGNVTIQRNSDEPAGKDLNVIILRAGSRLKTSDIPSVDAVATLKRFDSKRFDSNELKVGDEISVAYTIDGAACPNEPDVLGKVSA